MIPEILTEVKKEGNRAIVTAHAILQGTTIGHACSTTLGMIAKAKAGIVEEVKRLCELHLQDLSQFREYRRTQIAEMRHYIEGETLPESVSISEADRAAGSPKLGDMIARNPKKHDDQWLVAEQYFKDNFARF